MSLLKSSISYEEPRPRKRHARQRANLMRASVVVDLGGSHRRTSSKCEHLEKHDH